LSCTAVVIFVIISQNLFKISTASPPKQLSAVYSSYVGIDTRWSAISKLILGNSRYHNLKYYSRYFVYICLFLLYSIMCSYSVR